MLRTEAIRNFLHDSPYPIAKLYTPDMEVQVNVSRSAIDGTAGEIIKGTFSGKSWQGYTDGLTTWKSFRIPWNAKDEPRYTDRRMTFPLDKYVEAIGMTGWDWTNKKSRWVAFDFDSLISHKKGLTSDELTSIQERLKEIPFVSIYTSTSGNGLHVYAFINSSPTVNNHTEHAAVARAILNKLSALSGLELQARVDTLGGNMWVYHTRADAAKSFQEIKYGSSLDSIPDNWRDFLEIVSKRKLTPKAITEQDLVAAAHQQVQLDPEHMALLKWFETSNAMWYWVPEKSMLVCHTYDLKQAHTQLSFKGYFNTISEGKDHGIDQNCYCFPETNGGWIIRRHTRATPEHNSWFNDFSGWTTCYYNRLPTLRTASKAMGGVEGERDYSFRTLTEGVQTLLTMGIDCKIPPGCKKRPCSIKQTNDGRIVIEFDRFDSDEDIDWAKKKDKWQMVFFKPNVIDEIEIPDNLVRHLVSGGSEIGWFINSHSRWIAESKSNATSVLLSQGWKRGQVDSIFGKCILYHWQLVSKPFQPEYSGNRQWNKGAPQLRFNPEKGKHPSWDTILNHLGKGLDDATRNSDWADEFGIHSGYHYLLSWLSSFIQYPTEPLPYLTFTGPQNSGKSIFHESMSILFTSGYIRADNALTSPSGFNGELANAILCIIEETNLSKKGFAADRIKDWVTGRTISIHAKHKQPYDIPNCTHWVQCTNNPSHCPVFTGDTRIVLIEVQPLSEDIPKTILLEACEREAPQFINTLINYQLPDSIGRLRIPVLNTQTKDIQAQRNRSDVEVFINEKTKQSETDVLFSDIYLAFINWIGPADAVNWTNRKFGKELDSTEVTREKKCGNIIIKERELV